MYEVDKQGRCVECGQMVGDEDIAETNMRSTPDTYLDFDGVLYGPLRIHDGELRASFVATLEQLRQLSKPDLEPVAPVGPAPTVWGDGIPA